MSVVLTVKYGRGVSPDKSIRGELKRKILARKEMVKRSINLVKERLGNNSEKIYSDHMADCSDYQIDSLQARQNLPALESELRRIEKALKKLTRGTYGLCQDCGEAIPLARLEAMDWTACRCIGCQDKCDQRKR